MREINGDERFIEIRNIEVNYNTLEEIKALIELAQTKNEDLSELYVKETRDPYTTISLNLLIIQKIISASIEVNDKVIEILNQLNTHKEYTLSTPMSTRTETLASWAVHYYLHYNKEVGFKVLEFLFNTDKVNDYNPMVYYYGQRVPLLFVAIENAAKGDAVLWNLYEKYIDDLEMIYDEDNKDYYYRHIIQMLHLDKSGSTRAGELDLLQWTAYQYKEQINPTLFMIAEKLMKLGMNPYQKANCEGEEKNFFEISVPSDAERGWVPEDFGFEGYIDFYTDFEKLYAIERFIKAQEGAKFKKMTLKNKLMEDPVFNKLSKIKRFVKTQKNKGLDLSSIYIEAENEHLIISLNLLIIYKMVAHNIDIEAAKKVLGKFKQNIEYTKYDYGIAAKTSSSAYVYLLYDSSLEWEAASLKILEYILTCGAELNPLVQTNKGKIPLLFQAVNLAVEDDMKIWNLVSHYKDCEEFYDIFEVDGQEFNLLQYLAYKYRLENAEKEKLDYIAQTLITVLDPWDKVEYIDEKGKRRLGDFFEISGDNGWEPEDFDLKRPPFLLSYNLTKEDPFGKEIETNITDMKIALIRQLVEYENNLEAQEYLSSGDSIRYIGDIPLYLNQKLAERDYSAVFGKRDSFSREYGNRIADILRDSINNSMELLELDTFIDNIRSLEDNDLIASLIQNLEDNIRNIVISKLELDYDRLNFVNTAGQVKTRLSAVTYKIIPPTLTVGVGVFIVGSIIFILANVGENTINFGIIDGLANISSEMASVFKNVGVQSVTVVVLTGVIAGITALITAAVVQEKESMI